MPRRRKRPTNEGQKIVLKPVDCSSFCRSTDCTMHTSGRATKIRDKMAAKRIALTGASQMLRSARSIFQQVSALEKLNKKSPTFRTGTRMISVKSTDITSLCISNFEW
ncbi:hypothetical protein VTP01DRAFT_5798 [Rhizomucor pusillus]|uniref:uncharacterized protein n=1 Tax=Rhizomucor pusillus TaxID=4840 RepID=UPI003742909F